MESQKSTSSLRHMKIYAYALITCLFTYTACNGLDDEEVINSRELDEQAIQVYLEKLDSLDSLALLDTVAPPVIDSTLIDTAKFQRLPSGIYMKTEKEGVGDVPVGNFPIVEATLAINVLDKERVDTLYEFIYQPGITDIFTGGGLAAVSSLIYPEGVYSFIFPSNFAFQNGSGKIETVFVEAGDIIQLRMTDIIARTESQQRVHEIRQLRKWALDSGYVVTDTFPSGLTIVTLEEGPDPEDVPDVSSNNNYQVSYKGALLNGTVFDESALFEFNSLNNVIEGWRLGIPQLAKGEKALLLIPSDLAYGSSGNQAIPPYSPLIFEVTLLDF